ncbi:MAG: hypothetical protein U0575_00225 [Phycisphaerales bacterium]
MRSNPGRLGGLLLRVGRAGEAVPLLERTVADLRHDDDAKTPDKATA